MTGVYLFRLKRRIGWMKREVGCKQRLTDHCGEIHKPAGRFNVALFPRGRAAVMGGGLERLNLRSSLRPAVSRNYEPLSGPQRAGWEGCGIKNPKPEDLPVMTNVCPRERDAVVMTCS